MLPALRLEWQGAASGQSLIEVEGHVGMLPADLINFFGLLPHEQATALGPELFEQMQEVLAQPSPN